MFTKIYVCIYMHVLPAHSRRISYTISAAVILDSEKMKKKKV